MTDTALETRQALPDALRVLLEEYPRANWESDPGFEGLLRFWLDRHLMFRRILAQLRDDTQSLLNKDIDAAVFAPRLSRYGGMFVEQLHGHHGIEDQHYFPRLEKLDPRITGGFTILDKDHHAIDGHLNTFIAEANAVLNIRDDTRKIRKPADDLLTGLIRLEGFLNRHLIDEEELVVPVVLKYGQQGLA